MLTVTYQTFLDILTPFQKSLPRNTQELVTLHRDLQSVTVMLANAPAVNTVEPQLGIIQLLYYLQKYCTTAEQSKLIKTLHFKFVARWLQNAYELKQKEYRIDASLNVYFIPNPLFTVKWNNSDIEHVSLNFGIELGKQFFQFDCSAISSDLLYHVFNPMLANHHLCLYFLRMGTNFKQSHFSYLIEQWLHSYKVGALHRILINGLFASAEYCHFLSRERLVNALATAKKAAETFPDNSEFQQSIKRIKWIARMDFLKQKGVPVTAGDYAEAREAYEPMYYSQSIDSLESKLKNVAFYDAYRNFLGVNSPAAREKAQGVIIDLLKPLEAKLRQKYTDHPVIIADLEAVPYPDAYYSYARCSFPIAPEGYKKIIKKSALIQVLEDYFVSKGLLPRKVFARFIGFIDSEVANKVVQEGNLFLEHTDLMTVNLHGKLTHPLQLYVMLELIRAGIIAKPEGTSERELITDLVSQEQLSDGDTLWTRLIDDAGGAFGSPYELHTFFLMNQEFKKACPLIHGYLLDSYNAHQIKAKNIFVKLHKLDPENYSNLQFVVLYTTAYRLLTTTRYEEERGNLEEKKKSTTYEITQHGLSPNIIFKIPRKQTDELSTPDATASSSSLKSYEPGNSNC